jgi:hypothetical protein
MYKQLIENAIQAWNSISPAEYQLQYRSTVRNIGTTAAPWYQVLVQVYGVHGALFYHLGEYSASTAEEEICKEFFVDLMRSGLNAQYKLLLNRLENS